KGDLLRREIVLGADQTGEAVVRPELEDVAGGYLHRRSRPAECPDVVAPRGSVGDDVQPRHPGHLLCGPFEWSGFYAWAVVGRKGLAEARLGCPYDLGEAPEDLAPALVLAFDVAVRLGSDAGRGLPPLALEVDLRVGDVEPPLELGPIDLEVELDAPGALTDPVRLHGDAVAAGEQCGARREVVSVLVPLEDRLLRLQEGEQGVARRVGRWADDLEPDLSDRPADHLDPARSGKDLRAEADPQVGHAGVHRRPSVGTDLGQVRVLVDLVHVHRAAERHHARYLIEGRKRRVGGEVHRPDVEPGPDQRPRRQTEGLVAIVADEQDRLHPANATET